jgi:hypothetical protein
MRGKTGRLDKAPWRNVEPPRGPVEKEFLHPVLLGESIAPFRLLTFALAVLPIKGEELLNAKGTADAGHRYLALWLHDAEAKWTEHSSKGADGAPRMTLPERLDHMRGLSAQLPPAGLRVVYTKAGELLSAAVLEDAQVIIDANAYWAAARGTDEARYLVAILNSRTVLARIVPMQAAGAWGPRHFDKLVWELPIPEFDPRQPLHGELAAAASEAERIAAAVPLKEGAHFTASRRAIRDALAEGGIAERIDALVERLLRAIAGD